MTKKDYELLAQVIKYFRRDRIIEVGTIETEDTVTSLLSYLTPALKADNAAFNKDRFIKACGL